MEQAPGAPLDACWQRGPLGSASWTTLADGQPDKLDGTNPKTAALVLGIDRQEAPGRGQSALPFRALGEVEMEFRLLCTEDSVFLVDFRGRRALLGMRKWSKGR